MKFYLYLLSLLLLIAPPFATAAPERAADEASSPADDVADATSSMGEEAMGDVILQAMSLMGIAYRWGGNNPNQGFDCSGFIRYVFHRSVGMSLPRTAAEQARVGKRIDRSELKPGDLVFFNTLGARYSHVGLYIGNEKFIQAPRSGKNIEISSMKSGYWASRFTGARRVEGDANGRIATASADDVRQDDSTQPALAAGKPVCKKEKIKTKHGVRYKTVCSKATTHAPVAKETQKKSKAKSKHKKKRTQHKPSSP